MLYQLLVQHKKGRCLNPRLHRYFCFELLKVAPTESVIEKLGKYRTFKIISWAILEGAGLFSLIAFYITSNYLYVIIFILIFIFFLLNRASREGFVQDIQLSVSEKDTLFKG